MDQFIEKNEKELLREEFELVAANLKMIVQKKRDQMNYYEKELIINILKVPILPPRKSSSSKSLSTSNPTILIKWRCSSSFRLMTATRWSSRKETRGNTSISFWRESTVSRATTTNKEGRKKTYTTTREIHSEKSLSSTMSQGAPPSWPIKTLLHS